MLIRLRPLIASLAVVATLAFVAAEALAAPRMNAGSRGSRTYSAPPPTATSPNAARPIERSMTTPNQATAARPGAPAAAQPGGFFNRPGMMGGIMGGLAAGFLGAGLFGLLTGSGFMGGLAGFASFLGLLIQVGLVVVVAMLAWRWWQRRSQPQPAMAGGPSLRDIQGQGQSRPGFLSGGFGGLGGQAAEPIGQPIKIEPSDYESFERILGEVQTAYSNEDVAALRRLVTPEMLSYYSEELAANASRNVVNKLTDVKLLQGDLAEAWREGGDEYATVAMRYQQVDKTFDRTTGKLVEGSDSHDEGVEYWTFRRAQGGPWMVSAIQQTD
jgi:predicted lipid-binding transport protein (Tim44 family)